MPSASSRTPAGAAASNIGERDIDLFLKKLRRRHLVSADEEQVLRGLAAETIEVPRRHLFVRRDEPQRASKLLGRGFAIRYKEARSGERQIVEVHVPGDFVDLHSFPLKRLDHDIAALVDCTFTSVPHERLAELERTHPRLTHLLWFTTLVDSSIQREAMLTLSRRPAIARLAHIFCELHARLDVVDLVTDGAFDLPFSQIELAEVAGITSVHTNRMLRELRDGGLASFRSGHVEIHDLQGLARVADFRPDYLYLGEPGSN